MEKIRASKERDQVEVINVIHRTLIWPLGAWWQLEGENGASYKRHFQKDIRLEDQLQTESGRKGSHKDNSRN
jgi:hypothetical protein